MKRTTKRLLDDLLEDSASPGFRTALMDKTLRSARLRKRVRHFNLALGATALVGIYALMFWEMRAPTIAPNQIRQPDASIANSQKARPAQIVSAKPDSVESIVGSDSASALTIVQTTESARPREINDQQLLALLSDKPAALIHQGAHQAKLIFLNSEDEKGFSVQ